MKILLSKVLIVYTSSNILKTNEDNKNNDLAALKSKIYVIQNLNLTRSSVLQEADNVCDDRRVLLRVKIQNCDRDIKSHCGRKV